MERRVRIKRGLFKGINGRIIDECVGMGTYLIQVDNNNALHINKDDVELMTNEKLNIFEYKHKDGSIEKIEYSDKYIIIEGEKLPLLKNKNIEASIEIHMITNEIDKEVNYIEETHKQITKQIQALLDKEEKLAKDSRNKIVSLMKERTDLAIREGLAPSEYSQLEEMLIEMLKNLGE